MKCPTDTTVDLVMTERSGVEIDYCPTCRGVWLDRGELDKIIERAAASSSRRDDDDDDDDRDRRRVSDRRDDRRDRDGDHRYEYATKPKKKKSSFLGELFEF